ncbi:hypothetical protein PLICRDRAFT_43271 [Plicaturopsis crispa FD-325 SS-3]|nr:hypothetical protein PLICRDRAFT_43271 [Plicaturopsis crispa FD-325 SS-3]
MSDNTNSTVLGIVLLVRHGDRQGFYQDDDTYTATATSLTPLGNQQEFQLGQLLRSLYLNSSSPSHIQGINATIFNTSEALVRADAGGEGDVIQASAASLVQGLWPASSAYNTTLANGTTIVGPLNGYQYVPIQSIEPDEDVSLEGFTSCNTFIAATSAFYNSSEFLQKANESDAFLNSLKPYLDGRPVTLENMWNIFDYMNVQSIHNAAFAKALPPTFLAQARALANWHEYGVFTSPQIGGIGNIAGQAILPTILQGFTRISSASDPLKLVYNAIAYKPFLSLFNMTGVAQMNPDLAGIVDYAAAVSLEVRQPSSGGEPVIRFNFKNGTDAEFTTYNFLNGSGDVPLSTFVNTLGPVAVNTTAQWCGVCNNTQDRGCATIAAASQLRTSSRDRISPVGAGFLGAGLTLAVMAIMLGALAFFGVLVFGKKLTTRRSKRESKHEAQSDHTDP